MTKTLKKPPKFKSEAAERKFWDTHDTTLYFDAAKTLRATLIYFLKSLKRFRCRGILPRKQRVNKKKRSNPAQDVYVLTPDEITSEFEGVSCGFSRNAYLGSSK